MNPRTLTSPIQRAALVLVLLLTLVAASAARPSSASALTRDFNCGVIAVNSWCKLTENHSWTYASAEWNGTSINMCAKIINASNNDNGTRDCYTGVRIFSKYQPAFIGPNTFAMAANGNSGTSKTIFGWGTTSP